MVVCTLLIDPDHGLRTIDRPNKLQRVRQLRLQRNGVVAFLCFISCSLLDRTFDLLWRDLGVSRDRLTVVACIEQRVRRSITRISLPAARWSVMGGAVGDGACEVAG